MDLMRSNGEFAAANGAITQPMQEVKMMLHGAQSNLLHPPYYIIAKKKSIVTVDGVNLL